MLLDSRFRGKDERMKRPCSRRMVGITGILVKGDIMADKIRLGIIGANIHRGWAVRSHLPAVVASPEFELTAVCTTRMESAEESRRKFGAKLAFDDYREMLAHPDIDAVAVSPASAESLRAHH